jgi:biotin operon repressor
MDHLPILKGIKSTKRIRKLKKQGYEIKEVILPNGDTLVMKRQTHLK